MKKWMMLGSLGLVACSPETKETVERRPQSEVVAEAKTVAQAAFEALSGELGKAMAEGGPVHAIPFCLSKAGSLTAEVAEAHGVGLARLSDRPRNPEQRASGEDLAALEAMRDEAKPRVAWKDDGTAVVRLPIVINNPICLNCHGDEEIAGETRRVLSEQYPDDQATGYTMNDLRGIWRIEVPPNP